MQQHPILASELVGYSQVNSNHWYCAPHAHQCFELLYVLEGQCRIETSTGTTIALPNSIVLFRPFQWHEETALTELYSVVCLRFPAELVNRYQIPLFTSPFLPTVTQLPADSRLYQIVEQIVEEFQTSDSFSLAMIGSYLVQLAVSLQRILASEQRLVSHNENQAAIFQRLLDAHVTQDVPLRDLACQLHMSESHFCHSVKEVLGVAPKTYLREQRIARAQVLLQSTSLSIEEIALCLGYDEPTSFFRAFKRATGMTPGVYRQQIKLQYREFVEGKGGFSHCNTC
jgi:AraC family transcriptional activator of pobA